MSDNPFLTRVTIENVFSRVHKIHVESYLALRDTC